MEFVSLGRYNSAPNGCAESKKRMKTSGRNASIFHFAFWPTGLSTSLEGVETITRV